MYRIAISYVGYETAMVTAKEIEKKPVILIPTTYEIPLSDKPVKRVDKEQKEVFIIREDNAGEGGKKMEVKVIAKNGKEPVYVVNGERVTSIDDLDPEIIEKIEVFKDGKDPRMKEFETDAGVVMITTKKADGSLYELQEDSMTVFVRKVTKGELTGEEGDVVEFEVEIDDDVDVDKQITWKSKGEDEEVFYIVEEVPSFPGGNEALGAYIDENLEYPDKAKRNNMAGKVMVEFKVNPDGSLSNLRVAQSSNTLFDKAALKIFEEMPLWNPGIQRGKPVACKVIVPVRFISEQE